METVPESPNLIPDEAAQGRIRAQRSIERLERSQLRAIREHALGHQDAKQRLEEIDAEIAALRLAANGRPQD